MVTFNCKIVNCYRTNNLRTTQRVMWWVPQRIDYTENNGLHREQRLQTVQRDLSKLRLCWPRSRISNVICCTRMNEEERPVVRWYDDLKRVAGLYWKNYSYHGKLLKPEGGSCSILGASNKKKTPKTHFGVE